MLTTRPSKPLQIKVSKVLGAFGLLDFTVLQPVLAWNPQGLSEPVIELPYLYL
jgi:hypothetical protein